MTRRHSTGGMISARLHASEIEKLAHLAKHFELDQSATLRLCVSTIWQQLLAPKKDPK